MTKDDTDKLLDELLKGKKPEEILGNEGLLKDLTKRLVERVPRQSARDSVKRFVNGHS